MLLWQKSWCILQIEFSVSRKVAQSSKIQNFVNLFLQIQTIVLDKKYFIAKFNSIGHVSTTFL